LDNEVYNAFGSNVGIVNWIVIALYGVGIVGIGWYYSSKNKDSDDYLVGGRKMRPIAVGMSYFVALFSTVTYLSVPGEIVRYGPVIYLGLLALPLVYYVVGWFIIPVFMKLNVTSGYELLETRLGLWPRMYGVAIFLTMRLFWMGLIIYATVDKLVIPLTGLSPSATPLLCIAIAALAIVYTAMGGLKAIVTVDVFQSCLLFGGVLFSLGLITYNLGGLSAWWPDAWPSHWQDPDFLPSAEGGNRTILAAMVSTFVWFTCTSGSDQMAVQRYLATRDVKAARHMLGVSFICAAAIKMILGALGLALIAYAASDAGKMPGGLDELGDADRLFPTFIVSALPVGFAGLVIAGLLTEAVNSLSSGMNASSAVIMKDLVGRFRPIRLSGAAEVRVLRLLSIGVGLIVVMVSIGVTYLQGNLTELAYKLVSFLTAPLFSLFFFAIFVRRARPLGAMAGTTASILIAIVIHYWHEMTTVLNYFFATDIDPTPPLSFLWGHAMSLGAAIIVGTLFSLIPVGMTVRERLALTEAEQA